MVTEAAAEPMPLAPPTEAVAAEPVVLPVTPAAPTTQADDATASTERSIDESAPATTATGEEIKTSSVGSVQNSVLLALGIAGAAAFL